VSLNYAQMEFIDPTRLTQYLNAGVLAHGASFSKFVSCGKTGEFVQRLVSLVSDNDWLNYRYISLRGAQHHITVRV